MTTQEGNKLIAEFDNYWSFGDGSPDKIPTAEEVAELKYHTSWNLLMPVVEKINSLSYNDSNNKFQPSVERFLENDIESIWRQVVIFITWYNQTKTPLS